MDPVPQTPAADQPPEVIVSKKSPHKYWLILIILILLIIGAGVLVLLKTNLSQNNNNIQPDLTSSKNNNSQSANEKINTVDCSLSGQKAEQTNSAYKSTTESEGWDDEDNSRIIAKLLKKNPLVIEVLDRDPWSNFVRDSFGIVDKLSVRNDAIADLDKINFGDFFEAKEYSYLVGGLELGRGSGVYDIKKIIDSPNYYHPDVSKFSGLSRSGLLIRYHSIGSGTLIIYRDGTIYYEDKNGNEISSQKVSASEINDILSAFAAANFTSLPSKDDNAQYEPALALICNRYQNVLIKSNESSLKSIIDRLEKLITKVQESFQYKLTYEGKKQIQIIDWPLLDTPLSLVNQYHDEALAIYRQTGQVKTSHKAYTKVPPQIWTLLPSGSSSNLTGPFFRSEGKIYLVTKGYGCMKGAQVCIDNTLYTLGAAEIATFTKNSSTLNVWPSSVGISLNDVPERGLIIPSSVLENNKPFYDQLSEGLGQSIIDGEYLYERVKVERIDAQKSTNENNPATYTLKIFSKNKINNWYGSKPLSYFLGMYIKRDQSTSQKFIDLKKLIPNEINRLLQSEDNSYYIDRDEYYEITSLGTDTIFVNSLPKSVANEGYFTGYMIWNDPNVSLAKIPSGGIKVSETTVQNNRLKIQFSENKYYIEGDYLYILDLSNEP